MTYGGRGDYRPLRPPLKDAPSFEPTVFEDALIKTLSARPQFETIWLPDESWDKVTVMLSSVGYMETALLLQRYTVTSVKISVEQ